MITFQAFNSLALKSLAGTCLTFICTQFSVSFHAWATKLAVKNATETLNYTWPIDIFNVRLKTKYPFRKNKLFLLHHCIFCEKKLQLSFPTWIYIYCTQPSTLT